LKVTSLKFSGAGESELAVVEQIPSDIEYSDIVSREEDIGIDPIEPIEGVVRIQQGTCGEAGVNINTVLC
jgi:hypothetical protein